MAMAIAVVLAVLAIPKIVGAGYHPNYANHKDFWTHAHIGDDTPTWEDNDNHFDVYDVVIDMDSCSTYGGDIDLDNTVALELRRQITLWPDQGYGESLFWCEDEDEHSWIGVDDNGTFFAELDEIMGERSGDEAHLDRSYVVISP